MGTLSVDLGDRSYPIETGRDLLGQVRSKVAELNTAGRRCAIVADANAAAAQSDFVKAAFEGCPVYELPPGEKSKSFAQLAEVCEFLAGQRIDRGGVLFAFGGGVTGDLAGYAAASYLRGIDYIQVPTTLLAMVDSSVGGKTGLNLQAGKNLAGAFWQPRAVYADMALLDTLPAREFAAGMAEVIKYGMLGDAALFEQLENARSLDSRSAMLPEIVERCCAIKAGIVKDDERETAASGGRALLNLGHTFGHAIENVAGYGTYLHGEAVAIGLLMATRLSVELGLIAAEATPRVRKILGSYNLPCKLRTPLHIFHLLDAMQRDKKVRSGKLRFVAIKMIGEASTVADVDQALVEELWREVGAV